MTDADSQKNQRFPEGRFAQDGVGRAEVEQPKPVVKRCPHCHMPTIGNALGPTGAKIEAKGFCANCLHALDGSGKQMTHGEAWALKFK